MMPIDDDDAGDLLHKLFENAPPFVPPPPAPDPPPPKPGKPKY